MIKKSAIILVTAVFILFSYIVSALIIANIPNVTVFSISPKTVTSNVICSGIIEHSVNQTIRAESAGRINEVYVSEGDCIEKGDKLYSIIMDKNNSYKEHSENSEEKLFQSVLNGDTSSLDNYDGEGIVISRCDSQNIKTVVIYSNYTGVVGEVKVPSGGIVSIGDEIIKIADSNSMQARLNVSENKISEIKVGQNAIITCNALKDCNMEGTVSKIGNVAKQTTTSTGKDTTVDVIVKIDNGLTDAVKPGYTTKCNIIVDSKNNAMILPYETVKFGEGGEEYVLCYSSDSGKCEKKRIKTGNEYKDGIEVLSGLTTHDMIISSPDNIAESSFAKAKEKSYD